MKILIAVPYLTPGSGLSRYVFTLCKVLSTKNKLYVLTTHNSNNILYEQTELAAISSSVKLISTYENDNKIIKYIKLVQVIRSISPDILVNNYNATIQYILPLLQKKIKVVHVLHCPAPDFYRIGNINSRCVRGWVAPTKALTDSFNSYTNSRYTERITVIPHGVEPSFGRIERQSDEVANLLFVGMLGRHKGVHIIAPIVKRLKATGYKFHFTIVGSGVDEKDVTEPLSKEISEGVVELTGLLSHEEVYKRMSKTDIFVYPTHCDAFGLVIAEAMMNGAVPVVSRLPGVTDTLIDDGVNGYLSPVDDVDCFVNRISFLLDNRTRLCSIRQNAIETAQSNFTEANMGEAYVRYFQNILNS